MRRTILFFALLTGSALAGTPAKAEFDVCNTTYLPTRVAIGRFDGTNWTSQGWWTVQPRSCSNILTGPLDARYYYLYATDGRAGTWDGKTHFCITPQTRFLAPGRADCAKRGFDRRGFFEIDTGGAPDWTQTLSN